MGAGLVIIEPSTILRDWARTALTLPDLWAGGWPQTSTATTGIVLTVIDSTQNGAITTWSTQWSCWAPTQPEASALASRLATLLLRTPPTMLIGSNTVGSVLYRGAIEGTTRVVPVADDEPDAYRADVYADLLTIAVPA